MALFFSFSSARCRTSWEPWQLFSYCFFGCYVRWMQQLLISYSNGVICQKEQALKCFRPFRTRENKDKRKNVEDHKTCWYNFLDVSWHYYRIVHIILLQCKVFFQYAKNSRVVIRTQLRNEVAHVTWPQTVGVLSFRIVQMMIDWKRTRLHMVFLSNNSWSK